MADRPGASWQVSAKRILSHPSATFGIKDFLRYFQVGRWFV
jgi:hypothetical protein